MAKEFKSRTFRFGFPEGEHFDAFKEDINCIRKLDDLNLEKIVDSLKGVIIASTEKEKHKLIDEIVEKKLVEDYSIISALYRIAKYFFGKFTEDDTKEDNPKDIAVDIAKKLNYKDEEISVIEKLLILIKKESGWYEQEELIETFESGLFPNIKSIGTTVELRGVFNREIKFGEEIKDYSKDLRINKESSVVPTISVAITLDSGTPNRFCFQDSPENIRWLINKLEAALVKTNKLKEKYNF